MKRIRTIIAVIVIAACVDASGAEEIVTTDGGIPPNPLIYINSFEKATLTLGLNLLKTQIIGAGITQWHVIMAASVLVLIPNIIVFFLAQRSFMKGINVGGLKG